MERMTFLSQKALECQLQVFGLGCLGIAEMSSASHRLEVVLCASSVFSFLGLMSFTERFVKFLGTADCFAEE